MRGRHQYDPATIFVRAGAFSEAVEWAFWFGAIIWWIDVLGFSPIQLVMMGVALEVTILLSEAPTGVVADLYSRKWSVVIAQVIMGIGFIWAVASRNFWLLLPAQVVFAFGWTFQSGAEVAWLTDEMRGENHTEVTDGYLEQLMLRRHRFGIMFAILSVAIMMVISGQSIQLALVVTGVVKIGLGLWYAIVMREQHFVAQHEESSFRETLREGSRVIRRTPRLRLLVIVLLIVDAGSAALDRLGFKHFIDELDVDGDSILATGVLFMTLAAGGLAVNVLVSRRLDRLTPESDPGNEGIMVMTAVLLGIAAVGALITALGAVPAIIGVGLLLQDATRESAYPVITSWTNREAPSEVRATVHSLVGQSIAVGEITGGVLLGILAELLNIPTALVVSACCLALGAMMTGRGRSLAPSTSLTADR